MRIHEQNKEMRNIASENASLLTEILASIQKKISMPYENGEYSSMVNANDFFMDLVNIRNNLIEISKVK